MQRLNCPTGVPDNYDDAYVGCLNEAILGQSECSHDDDIGIRCTGMHSSSCTPWIHGVYICIGNSINIFMHVG